MDSEKRSIVIALCGKGGVGKTSISAMMIKILLQDDDAKVLAIDADPMIGLGAALNIKVDKTVDDIRNDIISKKTELVNLEYEVLDAMIEKDKLSFLAIGSSEEDKGLAETNTMLKDVIASIATDFDYIIIDGAAGIEQINRKFMEKVTHLVLVSDTSTNGINIVNTINEVAKDLIEYEEVGIILNRIEKKEEVKKVNLSDEIPILSYITDIEALRNINISGKNILEVPESGLIQPIRCALSKLNI